MNKLIVLVLILLMFAMTGCSTQSQVSDSHMNIIEGKVVEIRSGNVLLLEITKQRGGYKKEDKVLIHYSTSYTVDMNNLEKEASSYSPVINDIIGVQFWPEEVTQKDGYDYIEGDEVTKYIND